MDLTGEDIHRARAIERQVSRRELIEHDPDRVEIAAPVEAGSGGLFGRHVLRSPADHVGTRQGRQVAVEDLRDAEVQDLDEVRLVAPLLQHHVLGLEVAVDDVVRVRFPESGQDLRHDLAEALLRNRPLVAENRAKVLPLDVLHDDVESAVSLVAAEVEDLDAVRVVEPARRQGLALEAADDGRVLQQRGLEHLQADQPVQGEVAGAVDLAHSTLADELLDLEPSTDRLADQRIAREPVPESESCNRGRGDGRQQRAAVHADLRGAWRQRASTLRARGAARILRGQQASQIDDLTGPGVRPNFEKGASGTRLDPSSGSVIEPIAWNAPAAARTTRRTWVPACPAERR